MEALNGGRTRGSTGCDWGSNAPSRSPPTQLYAAAAVLIFTTLFLLTIGLFKRTKSNTVVLTGVGESGKTVIFYRGSFWLLSSLILWPGILAACGSHSFLYYMILCLRQLRDGSSHQGIVTSMEPNEGTFVLHSESTKKGKINLVHLVDVPGHSRLRPKLDDFLRQAACVVFVVDALEFLPNLSGVSEYLYDILTKASDVRKKVPVLVCCNKTDKVTAHTKDFIRKQIEKEMYGLNSDCFQEKLVYNPMQ